ncbi:MAG: porin, partial [Rhodobacteraceae bacterium]|nr:porin [Paracoccaceae bacterium]
MKKVLFASTALVGLSITSMASAEIALFGDARLGIGYNILNNGSADPDDDEDLRAISRVRFGVTMTGESDAGITYGATIRADNSAGGQGGEDGQLSGDVFLSGAWGTVTFGDTNGADEQHVGDAGGGVGLTGLGDFNETPYISNGGGFGDDQLNFANNPEARPTVRYDFAFGGFGLSASTNRDLTDVGVGASYTADFAGGSVTGGLGYYDFESFTISQ